MSERWRSGLAFLLSVVIFGAVVVAWPGAGVDGLRRALGLGDPLGSPADVPPGGTYAFVQHQPGREDDPVAWDPCRPIRYEVNPDGGPDDAEELARDAVEEVAEVTGLGFEYQGLTDRRPDWTGGDRLVVAQFEPVLIAWATEDEVDELAGDVAGVGGASAVEVRPGGWWRYVTGGVTLDEEAYDGLDRDAQRAILLHELGHLVGLDHVDSPRELMYGDNVGRDDFGRGDLNGLVRLGRGRCG